MINMVINSLVESASRLSDDVEKIADELIKEEIIENIYNPLSYAWEPHKAFIELGGGLGAKTLLLGMNPGPHGMGQMGIPFAATSIVRDLLGIKNLEVRQPKKLHPKREIRGLEWDKEEISGTRLWNILAQLYGTREEIFSNVFVVNHCPLMFFSGPTARNITPDKIPGKTIKKLIERCDQHLREVVQIMEIEEVIGVGKYAERRAKIALSNYDINIKSCWHPSPASPLANRNGGADWRENIISLLPPSTKI
ncbi:MAG: single-strand selective monofunctional uracil DNA glycosylase [Candidatus Thalassarchaeaceae archaeon]|jgi:single-strand selective monofunctional uracil DNA glycosylase|tara:strand:+ start:7244 stop:7999 length:756 start_codon:yes stop_codon:yes gene_type:complete